MVTYVFRHALPFSKIKSLSVGNSLNATVAWRMTLYKIAINVFIVILDLLFLIPPHNLLQGVI